MACDRCPRMAQLIKKCLTMVQSLKEERDKCLTMVQSLKEERDRCLTMAQTFKEESDRCLAMVQSLKEERDRCLTMAQTFKEESDRCLAMVQSLKEERDRCLAMVQSQCLIMAQSTKRDKEKTEREKRERQEREERERKIREERGATENGLLMKCRACGGKVSRATPLSSPCLHCGDLFITEERRKWQIEAENRKKEEEARRQREIWSAQEKFRAKERAHYIEIQRAGRAAEIAIAEGIRESIERINERRRDNEY